MNVNSVGTSDPVSPTGGLDERLDKNAFLRLLLAQLQNQDPLEPIKDQAFVAQLAEFSSLERLDDIAGSLERLVDLVQQQRAGLVDKSFAQPTVD